MHRLSTINLTEGWRPDVIRRGSLPLHVKKSDSSLQLKLDSRSSKNESRDSRRSKSSKKKDKKKESKKVLTITIPHDDNEIVPISDDEQDGSDKVSMNPGCFARTFTQRVILWLKISTTRSIKLSRIYFRLKYRLGSTTMDIECRIPTVKLKIPGKHF